MRIYRYPHRQQWKELLQRPVLETRKLEENTRLIIEAVKRDGDTAVRKYTEQFDQVVLQELKVSDDEINSAWNLVAPALVDAMKLAIANIRAFHEKQAIAEEKTETMPGVLCWRKNVAIEKVGLYIPGGTAPLFSTVLMLAVPAAIAGCKEIVICTPPLKEGTVHPAILVAAALTGITGIYKTGGVQAIAAMAFGTSSIPKVYKIFGPGNQYVTMAKQLVQQSGTAIDMPAGPSEVAVLADDTAYPAFIAADLLSQAEHGADSQVVLICTSEVIIGNVQKEITKQMALLPRKELAEKALANSLMILVGNLQEGIELLNEYAPEHLILACTQPADMARRVVNAGSVFIGNYSPESAGDYASGANHTLPTNGYAKAYSGVSVDSFVKKISFQELTKEGLEKLSGAVMLMARAEGLEAHANAVAVRLS